ncbi:MAG: PAS domain-containing protein [Chloroflexi bacterium]|jgi:PAS domain S-box-containing protein|nr:PAS domain-containing protein [Chloroflexota bacterium]
MEQWLSLFDHSGDGVFAVDDAQRIVYWNTMAEELLGYTAEQVLGRSCHRLL